MAASEMRWQDYVLVIFTIVLWSGTTVIGKYVVHYIPPLALLSLRCLLVALLCLPFVRQWPKPWGLYIKVALYLYILHFFFFYYGLQYLNAGTTALVLMLEVPFAVILAAIFLHEKFGWKTTGGIALAMCGVAVIYGQPEESGNWRGYAGILACCLSWGMSNIYMRRLGKVSAPHFLFWTHLISLPPVALASALTESGGWLAMSASQWLPVGAGLLYLVLAGSLLAYGIWQYLAARHPVQKITPFLLILPVVTLVLGGLFLGEKLTPLVAFGGFLTLCGVAIVSLRRGKKVAVLEA